MKPKQTPALQPADHHPHHEVTRTSHSVFRLRCCERTDIGEASSQLPVKLIVFDFDETLTLVTLMSEDGQYTTEQEYWAREVNFESPWVAGSRVEKLKRLLEDLSNGKNGEKRCLALLTRNGNANGVVAVLNLLRAAQLDLFFSVVWALPYRPGRSCGAFRDDKMRWRSFDPPLRRAMVDHKADVLTHMINNLKAWIPQLELAKPPPEIANLAGLKMAELVLVDDQRANFQSPAGNKIVRFCKVARYDAVYRDFGLLHDMGGIGAHDDADYDTLKRFVEDPWMCKLTYQVRCQEREFDNNDQHLPVTLLVFDFDETLTMATFMPLDKEFATHMNWQPDPEHTEDDWSEEELIEYNFESPYVDGSRTEKLKAMLKGLQTSKDGAPRTLAILTKNDFGVYAVLNLLQVAGLADCFSAIWTLPLASRKGIPNGAYRDAIGQWTTFEPPVNDVYPHKADILHKVVAKPADWFPQLKSPPASRPQHVEQMSRLSLENVVLVDDERANFRSDSAEQLKVLRYCKVARYDEVYRDCGTLNQMGGIGAHNDSDYASLTSFVEHPWDFPYESANCPEEAMLPRVPPTFLPKLGMGPPPDKSRNASLTRDKSSEASEAPKAPRVRRNSRAALEGQGPSLADSNNHATAIPTLPGVPGSEARVAPPAK
mmetsp:Transcript_2074/g.4807  ORF Transcript_2074/g.4807 Transcript_2074/m.4807 type:complete len:657 (+) Transcript_2074:1192-3162(+)|eukprot:CAMPEP_0206442382 /NCGR_PEP_ID=MMETSP0324_2-20121206/13793_1 /ASSEMBLY_ACC=CAM_ASM_000836 /TAXON_ID=2866 /ORGANISM="Crypthecodinium cohnii, Strain Seligo" /LENGTH=656 /DNA_ID=CAMNT_0053910223 /DNA_START=777 /DNA_END=2747 /DNA_ORIENTATION=-